MRPPSGDVSRSTSSGWLDALKRRDGDAWRRLAEGYAPLLYAWCRRFGLNGQEVPDVMQEVFRAVAGGLEGFEHRGPGTFRAWLRRITHSKVQEHFRQLHDRPVAAGGSTALLRLNAMPRPEDVDEAGERVVLLRGVLDRLRPEFGEQSWQAFWRHTVEGRSSADVATELGMTAAAVRQCKARILRRLREEMEET